MSHPTIGHVNTPEQSRYLFVNMSPFLQLLWFRYDEDDYVPVQSPLVSVVLVRHCIGRMLFGARIHWDILRFISKLNSLWYLQYSIQLRAHKLTLCFNGEQKNWLRMIKLLQHRNVLCNWSLARKIKERQLSVCFGQINIGLLTCSLSKLFSWMSPQWHHHHLTLGKSSSSHVTWIWATKNASLWRFVKEVSFDRMDYR